MVYDILVLGAGHAGVEASFVASKLNKKVALVTYSKNDISQLHCNVSIGGPAKGIVVRELDVFNALMPIGTDETQVQTKILNASKGPAVQVLRAQIDKINYPKWMQKHLLASKVNLIEAIVVSLIIEENTVKGVVLKNGDKIYAEVVIITAGTFLNSKTMKGKIITKEGPNGLFTIETISEQIKNHGVKTMRLKTGTPPRILTSSIDFSNLKPEGGSDKPVFFTRNRKIQKTFENNPAFLTYTNDKTHQIINKNITSSYLFSDEITGVGPRYCPSIEDKVKRFSSKNRHQLFLEIESSEMDTTYISGLSSSLPQEIQEEIVHTIPGLEKAIIKKYAYAIEYDSIDPRQLKQTLELKKINNLFMAGQVNGTSGYEEAAGQGLIAGVNAVRKINNQSPFIIDRNEGYLGVMIDDITTKGILDPYRLLTSRAEYRLLLRNDNAEQRLYKKAFEFDLISSEEFLQYEEKFTCYEQFKEFLKTTKISLNNQNFQRLIKDLEINKGLTLGRYDLFTLIKRPEFNLQNLFDYQIFELPLDFKSFNEQDFETISIEIKFEGYLKKQQREVKKYYSMQKLLIDEELDYSIVPNLAIEAVEKFTKFKPTTLHQASSISGINPSDIMMLWTYLRNKKK